MIIIICIGKGKRKRSSEGVEDEVIYPWLFADDLSYNMEYMEQAVSAEEICGLESSLSYEFQLNEFGINDNLEVLKIVRYLRCLKDCAFHKENQIGKVVRIVSSTVIAILIVFRWNQVENI